MAVLMTPLGLYAGRDAQERYDRDMAERNAKLERAVRGLVRLALLNQPVEERWTTVDDLFRVVAQKLHERHAVTATKEVIYTALTQMTDEVVSWANGYEVCHRANARGMERFLADRKMFGFRATFEELRR